MNVTKIDWTERSWNPIQGCNHRCGLLKTGRIWCYAYNEWKRRHLDKHGQPRKGWAKSFFVPEFFIDRLDEPRRLKKPTTIFVCSMGDLFDPSVPDHWRGSILFVMCAYPQHTYIILTKQPACMLTSLQNNPLPPHLIAGVSLVENKKTLISIGTLESLSSFGITTALSVEPLLERMTELEEYLVCEGSGCNLDWLIIGAQTGPSAIIPKREWIEELIDAAHVASVPIWCKGSIKELFPDTAWPQERAR